MNCNHCSDPLPFICDLWFMGCSHGWIQKGLLATAATLVNDIWLIVVYCNLLGQKETKYSSQ